MTYGDNPLSQRRPSEMLDLLAATFQRRYESNFAWKSVISQHLSPLGLRGFWPTSSVDENGNMIDLSGQSHTLTLNGNPLYRRDRLAPTVALDGTDDYFFNAGGVGTWCDILGSESYIVATRRGVTLCGWFRFDNVVGAAEYLVSKWDAGGNERSYALRRTTTGEIRFSVSDDGTNFDDVTTVGIPAVDEPFWAAGRYDDATEEIDVWYNDETVNLALAGWGGTIRSNATDFVLGGRHGGNNLMTGRLGLCGLYAASVPDDSMFCLREQARSLFGV